MTRRWTNAAVLNEHGHDHFRAYGDRYLVQYSAYGEALDVDALLAQQRPVAAFETWRKGDRRGATRVTKTAGVRIEVIESPNPEAVATAIEAFLSREAAFLRAAAERVPAESVLSCALSVYAKVSTTIGLPAALLGRLAELGVGWEVTGYPCADDDGP